MKRPELDPKRGLPNIKDSETNFTLLLQRTFKVGAVNTSTPAGRGNPPTKEPPTDNNGEGEEESGRHTNLNPGQIWKYN